MEILKIVSIGAAGTILSAALKKENPQFAMIVSIAAGVIIFIELLGCFSEIITELYSMTNESGIDSGYISMILKITGIAYISQIGSEICKDAGEGAIGTKIEIAGKVLIAATCLPLITALFGTVMDLL
ncbi:stage III sporulation protein AD [Lachnospiraceae bacterium NSJ-143]|nr:stage III sporulation protein AD [Lachnospiraceae bacterium NSJ-143]